MVRVRILRNRRLGSCSPYHYVMLIWVSSKLAVSVGLPITRLFCLDPTAGHIRGDTNDCWGAMVGIAAVIAAWCVW